MILNGFFQLVSVATVIPFLGVAANPKIIYQNVYLKAVYVHFNFLTPQDYLLFLGFLLIGVIIVVNLSNAFFTWYSLKFTWSINNSLSVRLMKRYMDYNYLQFVQRNSADLQKNIQSEVTQVTLNVINPILNTLNKGIALILTIAFLIILDPFLTFMVGFIFGIIYFCIYTVSKRLLHQIGQRSLEDNEAKFKAVNEALGAFKIAKLSNLEQFFISFFEKASYRYSTNQSKRMSITQLPRFGIETIAFSLMVGICLYIIGAKPSFSHAIPIIGLYAFAAYRIIPGMQEVYSCFSILRSSWPQIMNLQNELMTNTQLWPLPAEIASQKSSPVATNQPAVIEFSNVSFSYPMSKSKTLKDMSFRIYKNMTAGFMGETGFGKSTTIDLILGLLQPDAGRIYVNGEALDQNNCAAWQKMIGYVPQDIYLTDNTITANIAFGVPSTDINEDQVRKCARLANIDHFIENELIAKYSATVGERGVRLSGGQRQRIGIARALYHEPQLLVLDEATSSLDNETELLVMKAIERLAHQRTIIIIAHRITTLKHCDRIFKLDRGRIVKSGSFQEVVNQP